MTIVHGWFCKPKVDDKTPLYKFMKTFLTDAFVETYRDLKVEDLVVTADVKYVGGPLDMQEVYGVVNIKEAYRVFYVTHVVKEGLHKLLLKLPHRSIVA